VEPWDHVATSVSLCAIDEQSLNQMHASHSTHIFSIVPSAVVGTERGMSETFGSTCHGAGRALSRNQSRKTLDHTQVLDQLHKNDIIIRVASPKLITEEAPESYKNVCDVIETCQDAGISEKVVKLRPIAVIKG